MSDGLGLQLASAASTCAVSNSGLEVAVHVLIRIQPRRVGGQVKPLDLILVLWPPSLDELGVMNAQVVEDQEHLALAAFDNALHEINQDLCLAPGLLDPMVC